MNQTLKQLRESCGRSPDEMAKVAGISREWYYDLEADESELNDNLDVRAVARIAKELGVAPSVLYGGTSEKRVSTDELAALIRQHLAQSGESLDEFEEKVGYVVGAALADPEQFGAFNADGLQAASTLVGVHWLDVLDHLLDADSTGGT